MTFLPGQWEKFTLLRDLESEENISRIVDGIARMNTMDIRAHSPTRERVTRPIYYSDVKKSLRAMGGRNGDDWTLFVTLDENDDPLERYHINKKRGEVLHSRDVSYLPRCRTLVDAYQLTMTSVQQEHLQEASDTMTGIVHNGNLLLDGGYYIDWAYVMWMDIVLLYERAGLGAFVERVPSVCIYAGLRSFDQLTLTTVFNVDMAKSYECSSTLRDLIAERPTPLLYWRIMNDYEENENPQVLGLSPLMEGANGLWPGKGRKLINRFASLANHVSSLAIQRHIYKNCEEETHYKV